MEKADRRRRKAVLYSLSLPRLSAVLDLYIRVNRVMYAASSVVIEWRVSLENIRMMD